MAPNSFSELANTVEQYATKGSSAHGWRLDATEGEGPPNRLNVYPFATADGVGVHLSCRRGNITVAADVGSNSKATWCDFLPSVTWTKLVRNLQHEFLLRMATRPMFGYALRHPQFTFTSETDVLDGLSSSFTASTRLSAMSQLGLSAVYDPSRSGIKDYTFLATCVGCTVVKGGDLLFKYNATRGVGVHARVPLRPDVSAVALAETERLLVGVEARSPCGSQMMMNVNLMDTRAMLAVSRNVSDIWKITMNYSIPLTGGFSTSNASAASAAAPANAAPRFGIVFSNHNAP